ncbi:hypothetical protein AB0I95_20970 [Micromonospora sp. NPDC049751]|uniref:hypothetical protein n=1 Tax=unclassified Micromonospora TaxID=2617518 RepID=UPI0033F4FE72
MSDREKPSQDRLRQHLGRGEWAGIGAVVGLLSALVALLAWLFPVKDDPRASSLPNPSAMPTNSLSPSSTHSTNTGTPTSSATLGSGDASPTSTGEPKREVVHSSGSPRLQTLNEYGDDDFQNADYWDMDDNEIRYTAAGTTDLALNEGSLGGVNGTIFASPPSGQPTLQECTQIDNNAWSSLATASQLRAGSSFCVRSSEGRHGKLVVTKLSMCEKFLESEKDRERFAGDICVLEVSFLVWE